MNKATQQQYLSILKEELVLATGCTEPIAIAYCAAQLRQVLGALPERVVAEISGNILKNVKSVVVPNTGNLRGIEAAVAVGIVAGRADAGLQVVAEVSPEQEAEVRRYLADTPIEINCANTPCVLDITLRGYRGSDHAVVRIANNHANVVYKALNDHELVSLPVTASSEDRLTDKSCLNVEDIVRFADTVPLELLEPLLEPQVRYNSAIAEEGLKGWGAQIGRILMEDYAGEKDIKTEAKAWAAAGSDARMSGCEMPVVILSGSGNQGITASLPVIRYAKRLDATKEQLYRALAVSDLVTVHQKTGIGRLSAYCGAISAGVGAGAGICYLAGGGYTAVAHTVVNALAILSGTICDGAKPSCAAKIAAAVDAGIMGYRMYLHHKEFHSGEGIVAGSVDRTIENVGILAQQGMLETDKTILQIMQNE